MTAIDQFTRFLCPKCGAPGFDSWNKAIFDGVIHDVNALPNPWILGDQCQACTWPAVIFYTTPDEVPRVIFGPDLHSFAYESEAMRLISADPSSGEPLLASTARDADWSRGCLHAKLSGSAI
ncbi:MAG: hypothetical protein V4523_14255 [Pseudomonadota bacterium]